MRFLFFILPALLFVHCSRTTQTFKTAGRQLNMLFEEYFEEWLPLFPVEAALCGITDSRYANSLPVDISNSHRIKQKKLYKKYLQKISSIDPAQLEESDRINYHTFVYELKTNLESLRYNDHLMPVNQFNSMTLIFPLLGSGTFVQSFKTPEDYDAFLGRITGFQQWVDTAIVNMREGMKLGITQPKFIMEKVLPQLKGQIIQDAEKSSFFDPVRNLPPGFDKGEKEKLTIRYKNAIEQQVIPSYRKLYDFIKNEYLPACRTSAGLSELPDGKAWYASQVRKWTTSRLTPEEIFETGVREIERIEGQMMGILLHVGFPGNLREFYEHLRTDPRFYFNRPEELLEEYQNLKTVVSQKLPEYFGKLPSADFDIKKVEAFRETTAAGAEYWPPAADDNRPGIFYVNTYDLSSRPQYLMTSTFLHETIPGHHLQIALQQEQTALPRFRRYKYYDAFSEGWALYCEELGQEMGVYENIYHYFGKLSDEAVRAVRLVVDVGLHDRHWRRERALNYLLEHTAIGKSDAEAEIDRYIVMPGQALSYKVGHLRFNKIRSDCENRLGNQFNLKAFHDELLREGSIPLNVLAERMNRWVGEQLKPGPEEI